jgi:hypothetical protein
MIKQEFTTPRFTNTDEQRDLITEWQARYTQAISLLGSLGTEVLTERVRERDQDIVPYSFIRNAEHQFIFPRQRATPGQDQVESTVLDPTHGYRLVRESLRFGFNSALVTGLLRVNYDDADGRIAFSVTDMLDSSVLPPEVEGGIETLFNPNISVRG